MATLSDVYTGDFLKTTRSGCIGIPGEPPTFTGTIKSLSTNKFKDGTFQRVIAWAEDRIPPLGLNKTNWKTIAGWTGKDNDDGWVGEKVECYSIPDASGNSATGNCIRVRKPTAPSAPAAAAAPLNEGSAKRAFAAYATSQPNPPDMDTIKSRWGTAVSEVANEVTKTTAEFGPGEWQKVVDKADALFSPF